MYHAFPGLTQTHILHKICSREQSNKKIHPDFYVCLSACAVPWGQWNSDEKRRFGCQRYSQDINPINLDLPYFHRNQLLCTRKHWEKKNTYICGTSSACDALACGVYNVPIRFPALLMCTCRFICLPTLLTIWQISSWK